MGKNEYEDVYKTCSALTWDEMEKKGTCNGVREKLMHKVSEKVMFFSTKIESAKLIYLQGFLGTHDLAFTVIEK